MRLPDLQKCLQIAIVTAILFPYLSILVPCGGKTEQAWLDQVIGHLEAKRECGDPYLRSAIDYTIRRYNRIGPFCVAVVQLPEWTWGVNHPFCRGITVDDSLLDESIPFGASVLVHEAMHDFPPHLGHWHIDDERIRAALK